MSNTTYNNEFESTNDFYKVRSNFYNESYNRVDDLSNIVVETEIDTSENKNPKYLSATSIATEWTPCISLEYTGNRYNSYDHGGINLSDGFSCTFKADTPFFFNGNKNGCIGFAWTNKSLGDKAIPVTYVGSNNGIESLDPSIAIPDSAALVNYYGLFSSSLADEIEGLVLTLYPSTTAPVDPETQTTSEYTTKLSYYMIEYRSNSGTGRIARRFPDNVLVDLFDADGYYPINTTLSVKHTSGMYKFYLNDMLFETINDDEFDIDSWDEKDGYFTAAVISTPYIDANLQMVNVSDNYMHTTFGEKINITNLATSVKVYGAIGDGTNDDTAAFTNALKENRRVYVPGGTYKITGELVVRDNCELELAQDAVLEFKYPEGVASAVNEEGESTNTGTEGTDEQDTSNDSGIAAVTEGSETETVEDIERWTDERIEAAYKCITLKMSSSLVGNHATIRVPYDFDGIVIYASTRSNDNVTDIVPFNKWDPQWKPARYLEDVNIVKPNSDGLHSSDDGKCYGTAVFVEGYRRSNNSGSTFIWGLEYSGLRIAGAFKFGVYGTNNWQPALDENGKEYKNWAWTNDMKINGIIDGCEIAVYLYHCDNAYISTIIQPRPAENDAKYAKYGILLEDSKNVDLGGSRVWDWTKDNSKYKSDLEEGSDEKSKHQHIAMYGNCSGCFIRDHSMSSSTSFWDKIYYNNLASMFGAVVSGPKGMVPVDPKYAFYKNFNNGNDDYNKNNVSWRDIQNCVRYDVPVEILNGLINPNSIYKIGEFTINSKSENHETTNTYNQDTLNKETITIEENNNYGLIGWSNIYCNGEKIHHYWNPLSAVHENRVPIYYYSESNGVWSIYRLIRDGYDAQEVYNCRISITNARRFVFDFKYFMTLDELKNVDAPIINPITPEKVTYSQKMNTPKLYGSFALVDNLPVVTTNSATLNVYGEWEDESIVKELVTATNSVPKTYTISGSDNSIDVKTLDNSFYAQNILLSSENKKFRIIVNDNGTLSTEEINVSQ